MRKLFYAFGFTVAATAALFAQSEPKKTLAVLDFDVRNYTVDAQQLIDKATIKLI